MREFVSQKGTEAGQRLLVVRTLGHASVTRPDGAAVTFATRKASHLFLFLAATAPRRWPRTRLAGLFWSDRNEPQARGSLRQALTAIRRALGDAAKALAIDAESVGVDLSHAAVDAVDLRQLIAPGSEPQADAIAAVYSGPFLDGLKPSDPAFQSWLDNERRVLDEATLAALTRAAERRVTAGDADAALRAAQLALEIDPACEKCARQVISLEAAGGNREVALRAYERFRNALSERYDAAPEPETELLVARLKLAVMPPVAPPELGPPPANKPAALDPLSTRLRQRTAVAVVARPPPMKSADPDVEAAHSRAAAWRKSVEANLEREGGRAARFGANGMLGLFGAERSFGDDGLRAVRAALAIRDACDGAVGVAGGIVVMEASGVAGGAAIDAASGLSRASQSGEVRVDEECARLLADRLDLAPASEGERVLALKTPALAPFVGRRAELNQIEAALRVARQEGRGRVIHLRGEAGIGKTRLASEASRIAEDLGFTRAVSHALDFGGRNRRDAIRSLLRGLLGLDEESDSAAIEAAAQAICRRLDPLSELDQAVLLDLLDAALPRAQAHLLASMSNASRAEARLALITRSIAALAHPDPLLLLVEDVHWADDVSLNGLAACGSATAVAPVVLVVTSRIEGDRLDAGWRARTGGAAVSTIDLGPMSEREARAFAAAFGESSEGVIVRCIARADGNPLFLEQLLRLAATGTRGRPIETAEPASLHSVAQARLDLLPEVSRDALVTASVLGQSFSGSALASLMECESVDVDALTAHGMVHPEGENFRFGHALLREAFYATVLPSRRRALHARAASWFAGRDATLRAEHLEAADAPEAAAAFKEAAELEARRHRYARAAALAGRGAAIARTPAERVDLQLLQGQALHDLGDMGDASRAFGDALAIAEAPLERVRALCGVAAVKRVTDDLDGAFRDVDEALSLATGAQAVRERARLHHLRGNLLFPRGDAAGCLKEHEKSLAEARMAGDHELEAAALGGIGDAAYLAGRMTRAYQALGVCVAIAREHGFGRIEVANDVQRAVAGAFILPLREAVTDLERAREASRRVGERRSEINSFAGTVWSLFDLAEYERTIAAAEEARTLVRKLGAFRYDPLFMMSIGRSLHRLGDRREGLKWIREAVTAAEESAPPFHGPECHAALAEAAEQRPERMAALARSAQLIEAGCVGHGPLRAHPICAQVAIALGERDTARAHIEALAAVAEADAIAPAQVRADLARAALDEDAHDPHEPHAAAKSYDLLDAIGGG